MQTRILLLAFACFILLGSVFMFSKLNADIYDAPYILHLPSKDITLIVSNTNQLRTIGLGGMESLPEGKAMLFVFDVSGEYGIWMKDMKFPIDIFWLDDKMKIISIEHDISPNTYPKIYSPRELSTYVLETNSGFAKINNLKVGKVLNISQK